MRLARALAPTVLCPALLLAGCLSAQLRLPPDDLAQVSRIVVVPMESRPLSVQPNLGIGLPLFGLAGIAANSNEAGKIAAGHALEIQRVLDAKGEWQPNVELAKVLVSHLQSRRINATLSPAAQPLPGVTDRSYSIGMENWLAPIREWFNASHSKATYPGVELDAGALIAEVCLLNYELGADNSLVLRPLLRLVSPRDGKVVARASPHNLFEPGRDAFVLGGADAFRRVFATEASRLAERSLADLGLRGG